MTPGTLQWHKVQLGYYQSLYVATHGEHRVVDLQTRKKWYAQTVKSVLGAASQPAPRHVSSQFRAALQRSSGHLAQELAIDLEALRRSGMDFEERETAISDRIAAYVDRVLGVA